MGSRRCAIWPTSSTRSSDGSEVRAEWLAGTGAIGLTAGASTPDVLVDVVAALRRFAPIEVSTMAGIEEKVRFRLPSEVA